MDVDMISRALGTVALYQGDLDRASELVEECTRIGRELGDRLSLARSRRLAGEIAAERGLWERAEAMYRQALDVFRELDQRGDIVFVLMGLARSAASRGNARRALRLAGASAALREALRIPPPMPLEQRVAERYLASARRALGPDAERAYAEGRDLDFDDAVAEAMREAPQGGSR
jgi:tetratricopeptide (TPR) repeat protein